MATHGAKPPGIDSGVAMREFKDQTTQRFAQQEIGFEHLVLWTHYLLIDVCKDLGAKAPKVTRRSRFGSKTMAWKDVDLGDVRVQMQAAANLNRTPAGREQLVIEFAQAGIISTDQARRLSGTPTSSRSCRCTRRRSSRSSTTSTRSRTESSSCPSRSRTTRCACGADSAST
jgi:hypothetical protein